MYVERGDMDESSENTSERMQDREKDQPGETCSDCRRKQGDDWQA